MASPSKLHEKGDINRSNTGSQVPPYPGQHCWLEDWHKRWNREWLTEAVIPSERRMADRNERNQYCGEAKNQKHIIDENKRTIEPGISHWDAFVPGADKEGKRGIFRRALRRIILLLRLEDLRVEYRDYKNWRQEKREVADKVVIEADMEDQGDEPQWKGNMTFTMDPKHFYKYMDTDTWFPFPTPDNIRWYWVEEDGQKHLYGTREERWGPHRDRDYIRMPFRSIHGLVQRNTRLKVRGGVWCECRLRDDF
ncbi:hypothetical protein F4820DRAFT_451085 [Hypoxylon rubiginosum]|uniref:Uncharacterized protein n=1 Tax=Hypoxylon rubiginosum TaxID=110542 RepID=A0ACB9YSG1_9PEZI|nr:hypothetical protein F4820DRAFT_451085 [Hypoxylon rubiginosum]